MTTHATPALPRDRLRIASVEAHVFRYPIQVPVRTSFGTMTDRPAVFVKITDDEGATGWGEVWCNFPACGAEHRARLVHTVMAPLLQGRSFDGPQAAWEALTAQTAVLAIQSGEPGPMAQAISGIDLALWDLAARRAGQPLWRYLSCNTAGTEPARIPVYASGINPDGAVERAQQMRQAGHRAFKLKVGFGAERDTANLQALRAELGDATLLMADANQAWTLNDAIAMTPRLAPLRLAWLEEPLRADTPWAEWQSLKARAPMPLAGGENLAGEDAFDAAVHARVFSILQPDVAKWGGISACWGVVHRARAAGLRYCPHYLGGGLGLLASAHLLAAVGGDGLLEIDSNDNPLRSALSPALSRIDAGWVALDEVPGIGAPEDVLGVGQSVAGQAA
ncbi:mandelate racemase/muconate lactonizing enzyme family protein [Variovorax dokdonensis]|uniref:Mandelate racemase/muconate lactonizing enzyme family protein n=1 Tax=Variovorax dokdonensis TaxID=344883 RepID=A0ABT7NDZ7_9BURK|nr:mandelate racemase/muconate lactonizing enzyme family protein [Variovorax dokdonensis]MDM0046166.1 mandelate racemase/muconate lactonizing enzyme family protein [Variovorax dokdonensis]